MALAEPQRAWSVRRIAGPSRQADGAARWPQKGACRTQENCQVGVSSGDRHVCAAGKVVNVATAEDLSVFEQLVTATGRKYVMISGKGGVGKTSLSASLAVRLAEAGHTTLVVSTDPAHSLSDSLDQDVSGGTPVLVEGSTLPLWGMEVNPELAKAEFRQYAEGEAFATRAGDAMKGFGLGLDQLAELKLGELLDTPPPGLDEAVSLAKVVEFVTSEDYAKFSRIVFDTAPTGHTVRLLNLPDFVGAALSKLLKLREKVSKAAAPIQSLMGSGNGDQSDAMSRLNLLLDRVEMVKMLFQNERTTEFMIATIPTTLAVRESARLLSELRKQKMPCKRILVNQLIGPGAGDTFLRMKLKDQEHALADIAANPALHDLQQIYAPLLDLEVRGLPALAYFGDHVWKEAIGEMNAPQGRRYVMLGGKGGVGKTSMAASLGVQYATAGQPTLIVSTDPAHSLGDALDQDISGGTPVQLEGTDLPIWGMEIDVQQARQELREALAGETGEKLNQALGLGGVLTEQLKDLKLGELLDNPPPGADEVVAIAKVVEFLKRDEFSRFKRIIFDTAPTGHTLRLLTMPDFVDKTIGKILRIRDTIERVANTVKGVFGAETDTQYAIDKLAKVKAYMEDAKELFHDRTTTEFVIVTIPTVMAAAESGRLAEALTSEGVPVKRLVVNQVLRPSTTEKFLEARRKDQGRALKLLREDPGLRELDVVEAPLVDLEVRGIAGLLYFGNQVWK
ncbi:unnamed protein product [Ostreobium quekettii]|uniref:ArsA/GET3 Anion-transporting ATPase-like domain-containing protein n=1 Tax=Ostreobium quekettii TaxID=121088 RepID=A0A8S1J4L8_9CHLO|nr:unnamed protein product [Ostreobium quekettii]